MRTRLFCQAEEVLLAASKSKICNAYCEVELSVAMLLSTADGASAGAHLSSLPLTARHCFSLHGEVSAAMMNRVSERAMIPLSVAVLVLAEMPLLKRGAPALRVYKDSTRRTGLGFELT